jgi:trigger factor
VKSTVEPVEGNKVKLSVEVDEAEFDQAINAAFRKIAREVRIPGFRPGKAPRRVLEARFGKDIGRSQALEDALPDYYVQAVKEHEVDVIAPPEIDITAGQEEGDLTFDAVVEVRPNISVGGYQNLRVTVPSPLPTDEEVTERLETLRLRFADLETVDRPAIDDDIVVIDIAGSQGGEELSGLTADDFSYEVGSSTIVPEVDEHLRGAKVGDILEFDVEPPNAGDRDEDDEDDDERPEPLHFRVLVKEVKAKVLPALDDEFASEASEFDTMDELRDDMLRQIAQTKKVRGGMDLREKVGEALADLVEEDPPAPLVDSEVRQRLQDLALRLRAQGIDFETWLQATGQTQEAVLDELRGPAELAVKVDLALRSVAEAQEIEATDEDLDEEFENVAARTQLDAADVRDQFERAGEMQAVRSDVKKRKAFEWLLERVEIVDTDGQPLDRSAFEFPDDDEVEGEPDDTTPTDDTTVAQATEPTAADDTDEPEEAEESEEAE